MGGTGFGWNAALQAYERKLLLLPTLAVLMATAAFLCGGCCAAWQWWLSMFAAVAAGRWCVRWRETAVGTALFLATVGALWVIGGISLGPGWVDECWYHFPAVRMLADGWNPLRERTPETVAALFGMSVQDCRMLHVLFNGKIVWIFNAVAYFFTRDVFDPMLPAAFVMFPAVCCRVWRSMCGCAWWWKAVAVGMLVCIVPNTPYVVDTVVALSAVGLFLSFEEVLSGRGFDPFSLAVHSFWLMGSKTNGLVHGVIFWSVFLVFLAMMNRRRILSCVACGALAAGILAFANATPYITSFIDYGHPLYPRYTADEERFPSTDITEDFLTGRNADAASMGTVGLFVNAFVSPSLAQAWYRWKLDRPNFRVHSDNYCHYPNDGIDTSPNRRSMRIAFWTSILLVLVARRKSFGPIVLMVLLGVAAVPGPMMGYGRYAPWWLSVTLFALISLTCFNPWRDRRRALVLATCVALGTFAIRPWTLPHRLGFEAVRFSERRELARILREEDLRRIRPLYEWMEGHIRLMQRHVPELAGSEVLPSSSELRGQCYREELFIPGRMFVIDDPERMRAIARRKHERYGRADWLWVLHSVFIDFPKSVVERLRGEPIGG